MHSISLASLNAAPHLQIADEVWDFGSVTNRLELTHDFLLHNDGTSELRIDRVVSSCDACVSAVVDQTSVAPGETASVHCQLDLRKLEGPISRTITVSSNDPDRPSLILGITGTSIPLFQVIPPDITLDLGSGQRLAVAQILPRVKLHAALSRVQTDNTNMVAQISFDGVARFNLTVQPLPSLPRGRTTFSLEVTTADPADPTCRVQALINNPEDLEVIPPSLQLQAKAEPQARILWIRQHSALPMNLIDVVAPSTSFQVTVTPDAADYNYRVDLLAWEQQNAAGLTNQIVIKLRDQADREHRVVVPVSFQKVAATRQ